MCDYYNYVDLVTYAGLYNRRFHTPEYVIYKFKNRLKKYTLNGGYHNTNAPAYIKYYENGSIYNESYYLNGKVHNRNDPAIIQYNRNGEIIRKEYWVDGENKQK